MLIRFQQAHAFRKVIRVGAHILSLPAYYQAWTRVSNPRFSRKKMHEMETKKRLNYLKQCVEC